MALARIITRSQTCSRELALDLLARGYAVEIVSPDRIPGNLADLELRVEVDPGNQLVASVETHDGERSASLKFLHYLKAPMGDYIRRSPGSRDVPRLSTQPVSYHAKPTFVGMELPPESLPAASPTLTAAAEVLVPAPNPEEGAGPVSPPEPLPTPSVEAPNHFAVENATILRPFEPPRMLRSARPSLRRDPFAGWPWGTALAFASMVLLALVLGFGLRQTGKASAQNSASVPAEKVAAASTGVNWLSPADTEKDSAPVPAAVTAQKGQPVAAPSTAGPQARVSRRQQDDLIAPNTIIYHDTRFDPRAFARSAGKGKPAKNVVRRYPSSRKHRRDVIAASKITHLDKPTQRAAK
jgi:hypothetical protein